jgi:hypothetical protein
VVAWEVKARGVEVPEDGAEGSILFVCYEVYEEEIIFRGE